MHDHLVHRPFARRHPALSVVAAATTVWWLWQGWYEALALVIAVGLLMAVRRRRRATMIREAGLRARADYEHRLCLAGDPHGTFGRYPPLGPNWYQDPQNPCWLRYFDGVAWTPHVVPR